MQKDNDVVMKEPKHDRNSSFVNIVHYYLKNNKNSIKNVKILCEIDGKKINLPLLHAASLWGDVDAVKLLLSKGANIRGLDDNSQIAIQYAFAQGHADIVFELLCYGALDFGKENNIKFPLTRVRRKLFESVFEYNKVFEIIECKSMNFVTFKKWFEILCKSNIRSIEYLKRDLDDVEIEGELKKDSLGHWLGTDIAGHTLLHYVASDGDVSVCEGLLEVGCNVNKQSNFGYTPLFISILKGDLDISELLIKYGARDVSDYQYGITPSYEARMMLAGKKGIKEKEKDALRRIIATLEYRSTGGWK